MIEQVCFSTRWVIEAWFECWQSGSRIWDPKCIALHSLSQDTIETLMDLRLRHSLVILYLLSTYQFAPFSAFLCVPQTKRCLNHTGSLDLRLLVGHCKGLTWDEKERTGYLFPIPFPHPFVLLIVPAMFTSSSAPAGQQLSRLWSPCLLRPLSRSGQFTALLCCQSLGVSPSFRVCFISSHSQ